MSEIVNVNNKSEVDELVTRSGVRLKDGGENCEDWSGEWEDLNF